MTAHAKYALRGSGVTEVIDLAFAVPTAEARGAKGLISSQNGEVLDLVTTRAATISAVVTYE